MDTEEASQITQLGTPECVQLQPKHANTYWMWDLDFLDWETLPMLQTEQALPKDSMKHPTTLTTLESPATMSSVSGYINFLAPFKGEI
jgi:hypothetical protein